MQFLDFIYLDAATILSPPLENQGIFFCWIIWQKNLLDVYVHSIEALELELVTAFQWKVFLLRFYYHHHVYPELVTKVSKVRKQEIQSSSEKLLHIFPIC